MHELHETLVQEIQTGGAEGPQGPQGPPGPPGSPGPAGAPGATTIAGITGLQTALDNAYNMAKEYGIGGPAKQLTPGYDLNTLEESGLYMVMEPLNYPPGAGTGHWTFILNIVHNAQYKKQLSFPFSNLGQVDNITHRSQNQGNWYKWKPLGSTAELLDKERWDKVIYVDPINGSISDGDGTQAKPFKNVYNVMGSGLVKPIRFGKLTIQVAAGGEAHFDGLLVDGFKFLGGEVIIDAPGHTMWGLDLRDQKAAITFRGIRFTSYLRITNCTDVTFENCIFDFEGNNYSQGLFRVEFSNVSVYSGQVNKPAASCFWVMDGQLSIMYTTFVSGSHIGYFNAYCGGLIFLDSIQYNGAMGSDTKYGGGQVFR